MRSTVNGEIPALRASSALLINRDSLISLTRLDVI
jgi:hypothetical protein